MPQLYEKVMIGKRTTYKPYIKDEVVTTINLTNEQCLTAAGALGVTLLMLFRRNMPEHKLDYRLIERVETSILALFHKSGQPLDSDIADLFCKAWDMAMTQLDKGIEI